MNSTKGWVVVIGILVLIAVMVAVGIWLIFDAIQRTVTPVESMTGNLSTQVASLFNPTPTIIPNPITIIHDIRSLARLETIQYSVEKVITAESGQGALGTLFGDRLIFIAHGKIIAGVDMARLGPDDLQVKNNVLYVKLPEPEVFISALDNDKSYVYDRDTGLFTKGDIDLESTARRVAEEEIEKAAREDGILDLARQNAEYYLSRLFRDLGYAEVIFVGSIKTPTP
jgi:hypothetical protein